MDEHRELDVELSEASDGAERILLAVEQSLVRGDRGDETCGLERLAQLAVRDVVIHKCCYPDMLHAGHHLAWQSVATTDPLVAVVIPVHNGERHLGAALVSARAQSLTEIEIIVVDDDSTDRTAAVVEEHARDDPRIRRIEARVHSAGAARNIGWRAARAPFIGNLDQDDLAEPERLERQYAFLLEHPDVGLVGGFCHLVDDAGVRRGNMAGTPGRVTHAVATFRRSALELVGGYREIPGTAVEDIDLYGRIAESWQVANLPEYLGAWRIHGGNSSLTVENMVRWTFVVLDAADRRREGLPDPLEGQRLMAAPTDEELASIGVDRGRLDRAVFEAHVGWIGLLLTVGEVGEARRHLDLASQYVSRLTRGERASFLVGRAQVEFAERRRIGAVVTTAGAFVLAPPVTARKLAHPVVGGLGRTVYRRLPVRVEHHVRGFRNRVVDRLNRVDLRS